VHAPELAHHGLKDEALTAEVRRLLEDGLHVREIVERLKERGVARRAVYEAARAVRAAD
jgi:hypothetical protein